MLSRRQFFSITVIMLVLLVMFQLTGVMKDYWNDYETNEYADTEIAFKWQDAFKSNSDEEQIGEKYIVYIGNVDENETGKMVQTWCSYSKKDLLSYENLSDVNVKLINESYILMLDSEYLDFSTDTEILLEYADKGVSMIFCNLPDVNVIKNSLSLNQLLGIFKVKEDSVKVNGIDLYEDFFLGGRTIYEAETKEDEKRQDLNLTMPWYTTYANVKRYMVGLVDENYSGNAKIENEDMPSVIWRNNIGDARIFVISGDYAEDITALGIYSAMEYEMSEYLLYPVVNAQSVSVVNFAGFSDEADEQMQKEYSRTQQAVFQDLVLPSLDSIFNITEDKPTFFLSPKLDYTDGKEADDSKLVYYMKLFGESKAEAGLSSLQSSKISLKNKLDRDISFYENIIPGYKFCAMYMSTEDYADVNKNDLSDEIRTISLEYKADEAPIGYSEDGLVLQRATSDGFKYKYSDDLRLKSLETALAYSNISVDLGCILYSDDEEDTWEHSSERLASNVVTYWKPFKVFDKTTITESDSKVRQFLNLTYDNRKEDNVIYLSIEQFDTEASFILRTHNESIESVKGGEYEKIEEHAYLIKANKEQIEIYLKSDIETDIY